MKNRKFIEVKINDRYLIKYKNVKITGFRELEEYESLESLFEVRILTDLSIECEEVFINEVDEIFVETAISAEDFEKNSKVKW